MALDAAARKVLVDGGYGPGFKYFTHRVGRGLGMEMHEWSYFVKGNMYVWPARATLQPGMVFSDEPGIYIRGEFGIRLEDDLHVTETGAELLTVPSPRSSTRLDKSPPADILWFSVFAARLLLVNSEWRVSS